MVKTKLLLNILKTYEIHFQMSYTNDNDDVL